MRLIQFLALALALPFAVQLPARTPARTTSSPRVRVSKTPTYSSPRVKVSKPPKHHAPKAPKPTRRSPPKRSPAARSAFVRSNPCPSTGKSSGSCKGYVVDHIKPLACGGADDPSNMQWQTSDAAKRKDTYERSGCR